MLDANRDPQDDLEPGSSRPATSCRVFLVRTLSDIQKVINQKYEIKEEENKLISPLWLITFWMCDSVLPQPTLHEPAIPLSIKILRILIKNKGGTHDFYQKSVERAKMQVFAGGEGGGAQNLDLYPPFFDNLP